MLFNSIIYLFLSEKYDGEYFYGLLRSMYLDLRTEILNLQDEFGSSLNYTSQGIMLNYSIRTTLLNPTYTNKNHKIIFQNISNVNNLGILDLFIKNDNKIYLIPSEALDESNSVPLEEIREKWIYAFEHPIFSQVLI